MRSVDVGSERSPPAPDPGEARRPRPAVLSYPQQGFPPCTFEQHCHFRGQILHLLEGVLGVQTSAGAWTLPPRQLLWVPPGVAHEVRCATGVRMRFLYVHPAAASSLPTECTVVSVDSLLELLLERFGDVGNRISDRMERLGAVLLDELADASPAPLNLPLPEDPRLVRVTTVLRETPGDTRGLREWAELIGTSERTLARVFERELGMGFVDWRQRLRLQAAIERLGAGESVTRVALDLGYRSSSAFGAMFRRALGESPTSFLNARKRKRG